MFVGPASAGLVFGRAAKRLISMLLVGIVIPTSAFSQPASQPRFDEKTDVVVVEVPVQVVRDGQPVRGLTAADFEVYDGRKKQAVTGFEVVDLATVPAPSAATQAEVLSPAARRHFLMLFDLSNSEPKSISQARTAAAGMVAKKLHATDLVAVATFAASRGPQLVLGFTSDRNQIARALDTLGLNQLVDRTPDPLRLVVDSRPRGAGGASAGGGGQSGVNAEEAFLANIQEDLDRSEAADRRQQVQRLSAYTRSMADLGKLMSNVDGRKYVVLLSEGFDSSLVLGTTDEAQTREINAAVESGEIWKVDSDQRFGSTQSGNDLERMIEEFRRADCVIQAVDIGGLRGTGSEGFTRPQGTDGLFAMAQQTGGELYRNFNDLGEAMGQMLNRTQVTYVLAFQPEVKRDGAFHRLKIELKNAPRGTRVISRPGYYAPKPFGQQDNFARLFDAAEMVMGGREQADFRSSVLAAPFRGVGAIAYVPVLIELEGKSLLAGTDGNVLPAEIYAYALAADGTIADYFGQTLGLDLSKTRTAIEQGGLKFFGHLELPAGEYSLRILSRNGRTGSSALSVVPLTVPTFNATDALKATLLRPFFPEAAGKWMIVRENPRGEQKNAPYPFLLAQQPYVPASLPILGAGQDARMTLVGYNLGEGDIRAQVTVIGADGQEMPSAGELKLLSRERGSSGAPDVIAASFRPSSLKPGQYQLKVKLATGESAPIEAAAARFEIK